MARGSTRTPYPGNIAYGPRTGHSRNGAPRGSGARQYLATQYADKIFAQRSDGLDNTLGLGITGRRLITQASPSTASPDVCMLCQWWTVQLTGHFVVGDAADPPPNEQALSEGQRFSHLQVMLEFGDGTAHRQEIPLDVGPGFGLSFWGSAPKVYLLLDQAMVVYRPPKEESDIPAGSITSHLIEASLQCGKAYNSPPVWQSTITRQVPANSVIAYPTQPRSQSVQVFQSTDGPPAVSMLIDPTNRTYVFDGTTRRGPRIRLPGDAEGLSSSPTVNALRVFSVVHEVKV